MRNLQPALTYSAFRRGLVLLVLAAVLTLPASAQMTDRQWELGFAVGTADITGDDEDFNLDLRGDFRTGYLFSDNFQLELQLIQADATLEAQLRAAMLNGVFNFRPESSVVPYFLVGAGAVNVDDISFFFASRPDESAEAFQVGFGSRFFVGDEKRMAVRLELSSLWVDLDTFQNDHHTSLTAGLSWMLGER